MKPSAPNKPNLQIFFYPSQTYPIGTPVSFLTILETHERTVMKPYSRCITLRVVSLKRPSLHPSPYTSIAISQNWQYLSPKVGGGDKEVFVKTGCVTNTTVFT